MTQKTGIDDLLASVVVFLVALPLCMGIAIASGVPPALGLMTGIIGGLVVGFLAGAPLQVSGPAAGLTVLVWQLVQDHGLVGLGLAVFIGGAIQFAAGLLGLGRWFRAVSPAVIHGMLAGIGILILASQFHVMLDDGPQGDGLSNLLSIPAAIIGIFTTDGPAGDGTHQLAALIGVVTILALVMWAKFRPSSLRVVPAPLLAVIIGSGFAFFMGFDVRMVSVPDNLLDSATWLSPASFRLVTEPGFVIEAIGIAVIASAETLLCATAVDKMHKGPRADYDKELRAQGIGNAICGVIGALPMTGVIVRSSANVDAGGKTRLSAILHGVWLLAFVVVLPHALEMIPLSVLAAILVYTGYRLVNVANILKLSSYGRGELAIYVVTVVGIVATDLLTGVILGLVLSMGRVFVSVSQIHIHRERLDNVLHIHVSGAATVLTLPKLAHELEAIPSDQKVVVHVEALSFIDHACLELIEDFHEGRKGMSAHEMELDIGTLQERYWAPDTAPTIPAGEPQAHAEVGTARNSAMSASTTLVATDFSEPSRVALDYATTHALRTGAKLLIVHAFAVPSGGAQAEGVGVLHSAVDGDDLPTAEQRLKEFKPDTTDVRFEHRLVKGDPAEEILRLAKDENAERIVIGTHGRTGLMRALMGSVAEQVVRAADCAVVTVKVPKAAGETTPG